MPPSGQVYAVVQGLITNNGSSSYDYNPLYFKLQDGSTSQSYDAGAMDINMSNTTLSAGILDPGQSIGDDLVFQLPDNQDTYGLLWTPTVFGDSIPVPLQ